MEQKKAQDQNEQQNNPLEGTNPTDRDFQRTAAQDTGDQNSGENAVTSGEDTDPVLTEQDLEDNNLSVEEADKIEWEPQQGGSEGAGDSGQGDTKNVSE